MSAISDLAAAGLTYRRLDHWIRQGWIKAEALGTGHPRDLTAREVRVARLMHNMTEAGITAAKAAQIARAATERPPGVKVRVQPVEGVWITVTVP